MPDSAACDRRSAAGMPRDGTLVMGLMTDRPLPRQAEAPSTTMPSSPFVLQYDLLRDRLRELSSAPVPDKAAIEAVMAQLDEAHAALKAHYSSGADPQRY